MLRRLYDWTLSLAAHRHAMAALALVAFVESSVFPIPPDVLIVAMVLARRDRAFRIALVATVASVIGGLLGYAIGFGLFDLIGRPVLDFYGYADEFERFRAGYNEWGAWSVFVFGLTPFPYKVITILSGVTGLNLAVFVLASVLARGLRFFIVAALLWRFGPPIRAFIEARLGLLFILFVAALLAGFVLVKYVL